MNKFCPSCGKKTDHLIENLCEECFKEREVLLKIPSVIRVEKCARCSKIRDGNKWTNDVESFLKKKIGKKSKLDELEIKIDEKDLSAVVIGKGKIHPKQKTLKTEKKTIKIYVVKRICESCKKKSGGNVETIIQLRGNVKDIIREVEKILNSEKKDFLTKKEKVKNGIDLYFGSKRIGRFVVKALSKKFKVEIKKSYKLVTRKEGRNIYREVISVRSIE